MLEKSLAYVCGPRCLPYSSQVMLTCGLFGLAAARCLFFSYQPNLPCQLAFLPTHLPPKVPNIIDEDEKLFHSGQWVATSLSSRLPDFLLSASDVALAMEPTHF